MQTKVMLSIFTNIMQQMGKSKSGTYNAADPTAYENRQVYLEIEVPYTEPEHLVLPGEEEDYRAPHGTLIPEMTYPVREIWEVNWNSITWGDNLEIYKIEGYFERGKMIIEDYWDNQWCRNQKDENGNDRANDLIELILTQGTFLTKEQAKVRYEMPYFE